MALSRSQPASAASNPAGTGPVSPDYLDKHQLRGISLDHIRRDRILHEALAAGADPLHLALVFNIDHANAMAYANAARNLLTGPAGRRCHPIARHEHDAAASREKRTTGMSARQPPGGLDLRLDEGRPEDHQRGCAHGGGLLDRWPMSVPAATIRARSPAKPGGIRRFRYEANGQECPDWFKIPRDLDPASAKWQMFLLGPGATIHA